MNIEVQIKAPELSEAITQLALALKATAKIENGEIVIPAGAPVTVTEVKAEPEKPKRKRPSKMAAELAAESAQDAPTKPETRSQVEVPATQEPAAEARYEVVAEHPAAEDIAAEARPTPTLEQISTAGAQLLDDDPEGTKMTALLDLLGEFGVQAVTQLQSEQLANFAARLREIGAEV